MTLILVNPSYVLKVFQSLGRPVGLIPSGFLSKIYAFLTYRVHATCPVACHRFLMTLIIFVSECRILNLVFFIVFFENFQESAWIINCYVVMFQADLGFYGLHSLAYGTSELTPETLNLYVFHSTSQALAQPVKVLCLHRTTQTGNKLGNTYSASGIRTHNSSVRTPKTLAAYVPQNGQVFFVKE